MGECLKGQSFRLLVCALVMCSDASCFTFFFFFKSEISVLKPLIQEAAIVHASCLFEMAGACGLALCLLLSLEGRARLPPMENNSCSHQPQQEGNQLASI